MGGNTAFHDSLVVAIDCGFHFGRFYEGVHYYQFVALQGDGDFLGADWVKLDVQAGVFLTVYGDCLVHAARSRADFPLKLDTPLHKVLLADILGPVGSLRHEGTTDTESRGTRNS